MEPENKKVESQGVDLSAEQQLGVTVASQSVDTNHHDDVPTVWKIFGGAIVSIIFMLIVTIFGYIITNLNNVQSSINCLNADMVKKTEFNDRLTHVWQKVSQVDVLKDRTEAIEKRCPTIDTLKEKSATTDQRINMLENQVKSLQEENKTQAREITALRERLAVVEAAVKRP